MAELLQPHYQEHFELAPGMYASSAQDMIPETTRVLAAWADLDQGIVNYVVSDPYSQAFLKISTVGQRTSLVAVTLGDLVAYQYKGEIVKVESADAEALNHVERYVEKFCELVVHVGIDPARYRVGFVAGPYTKISMRVDVIFDQTPRVGAGQTIASEDRT